MQGSAAERREALLSAIPALELVSGFRLMLPSSGLQGWSGAGSDAAPKTQRLVGSGHPGTGRKAGMVLVTRVFCTDSCPGAYLKDLAPHMVGVPDWSRLLPLSLSHLTVKSRSIRLPALGFAAVRRGLYSPTSADTSADFLPCTAQVNLQPGAREFISAVPGVTTEISGGDCVLNQSALG